ncbi:MAG: 30S ribosomal protein S4 [Candidatus Obscuribacter sp.]|nr:30S ribosomal protein S4 [Candidatus Obscuribacter sp.]
MKYLGSICKRVRAVGMTECSKVKGSRRQHPPGQHGADRKKKSDYAKHLMEKQKIRWTYNISEKQFYNTFQEAVRRKGVTGTILLQLLESRLDNVVFRSGLVGTRAQGRQLINHGHFLVNGKPVNIASYRLRPTDKVSVRDKSRSLVKTMQRGWLGRLAKLGPRAPRDRVRDDPRETPTRPDLRRKSRYRVLLSLIDRQKQLQSQLAKAGFCFSRGRGP